MNPPTPHLSFSPRDGLSRVTQHLARNTIMRAGLAIVSSLGLIASAVAVPTLGTLTPTLAATPIAGTGQMITNTDTLPYGAIWMNDNGGGHLWVTDQVLGVCEIVAAPSLNPPWQRTNCNGTTKAGGQIATYSTNVTSYTWTDSTGTHTTNQYWAPFGLGVNTATGDLYVGDDPTQGLPAPGAAAPATNQGHIWKVAPPATTPSSGGPAVTSISPATGSSAGGDVVTITGTGFGADIPTVPPTPGSTILFGSVQATNVSCTTPQCTATSPAGKGTVDVRVQTNGEESPTNAPADQFTYNTASPRPASR